MIKRSYDFSKSTVGSAALFAALLVASCAGGYSMPQQVETTKPTVTYKYVDDEGLIKANQDAATFCNRYSMASQAASFTNDQHGNKVVVFECVASATPAAPPPANPNLTYNYRSDRELLNASRNAQIYCANSGSQQMNSTIVTNPNGTRTVTFQCSRG